VDNVLSYPASGQTDKCHMKHVLIGTGNKSHVTCGTTWWIFSIQNS